MYFVFCPFFVSKGILFNDLPAHFSRAELTAMQTQYIGMFQAGWFVESMWSQTLVIHMIRTPKLPFIQSRASAPVTLLTMTGITILTVIPFTIFGKLLGFVALPAASLCVSASVYLIVYGFGNKLEKGLCPSFWRIALRRCSYELERTLDDTFWNYGMSWSEYGILDGFRCRITDCNSYERPILVYEAENRH